MNQAATAIPKPVYSKREASRLQIIEAARKLVMEIGYPLVTMTTIAERAKVSRATLYRYYSTKEQLYSDVSVKWAIDFIDTIRRNPPQGDTVGARVSSVIRQTINAAAENPRLMAAHIATMISDDMSLKADQRRLKSVMPDMIKTAMGSASSDNLDLTSSTLQHVLISNLILLNAGKTHGDKVIAEMERIASRLLADVWDKP